MNDLTTMTAMTGQEELTRTTQLTETSTPVSSDTSNRRSMLKLLVGGGAVTVLGGLQLSEAVASPCSGSDAKKKRCKKRRRKTPGVLTVLLPVDMPEDVSPLPQPPDPEAPTAPTPITQITD